MRDNYAFLKLYNSNVNINLIDLLFNSVDIILDLINESDKRSKNQFIIELNDFFDSLFEPLSDQGYILFKKERILKSSFFNHGQKLDDFNSYIFLELDLLDLIAQLDHEFYSDILSYLLRFYKSCFNKINSSLVSVNYNMINLLNENGRKVKQTVQDWKAKIKSREVIEKRKKLKSEIVEKLPFGYFTYCCSIDNLAGILDKGILSHNEVKRRVLNYTDISDKGVNKFRSEPNRYLNYKPAHDFVNLHINPQNPIIYHFIKNAKGKDKLVCLNINPHVIVQRGGYFSEGNVAKASCNQSEAKISNDLNKFEYIDWAKIRMPNPKNNLYEIRKAEILIEEKIELEYIDKVIVYSYDVAFSLMKYFPNHLGVEIVVDKQFFDNIADS